MTTRAATSAAANTTMLTPRHVIKEGAQLGSMLLKLAEGAPEFTTSV